MNRRFLESFQNFLQEETPQENWQKVDEVIYENQTRRLAVALRKEADPIVLLQDSERYETRGWQLVQLWEDVWVTQQTLVESRLKSLVGISQRIPARLTLIQPITPAFFQEFLSQNHLQIPVKCAFRYGLFLKEMHQNEPFLNDPTIVNDCVAVAGFGPVRPMPSRGNDYYSGELIRFANVRNHTVVGGLDKLLKAFLGEHPMQDLMTYADRDWSTGKSYERLGFERVSTTPPQELWLDPDALIRYYPHRVKGEKPSHWRSIFNTGNYKYIKKL
ncbi:hypothetical protein [Siphonobacter curvatus]|uniref:Uncharacterized protein n=1 Tax=Siphonobacter curvatus TaxID=2094562 RepID=A0A2S7IQ49_9BACT|nr:hypothetical protein [Siphonobacter curvatus]PQA59758.1 hypothetical protein C5O19_09060 [Siphonobacter curvatus]